MKRYFVPAFAGKLRKMSVKLTGSILTAVMVLNAFVPGQTVMAAAIGKPAVTDEPELKTNSPEDGEISKKDSSEGTVTISDLTKKTGKSDPDTAATPEPGKPEDPGKEAAPTPSPKPTKKPGKSDPDTATTPEPGEPEDPGKETAPTPTPKPTKKPGKSDPDATTTPEPGETENPDPDATTAPELTSEPKDPGEETTPTPLPKPTKKPGKSDPDVTTPPESEESENPDPDVTTDPELTSEPKDPGEETTPTPTPSTKPTKKPGKSDPDAATTPDSEESENPDPDATTDPTSGPEEPGEEATSTPKPAPQYPVNLPTESNDARYQYLLGINAREITMSSPPKGYESAAAAVKHMTTITVPVWKMTAAGKKYTSTYQLTINKKLEKCVKAIFKEIYNLPMRFPIKELKGYYYRKVGGVGLSKSTLMSVHSFGAAIDINPGDYDNDYFLGKGNDLRDKSNPYCIPDEVIEIFEKYGWFWGGNFEICSDTMHFQYLGLEFLTYQNNSPFRTLKLKDGYMKGTDVWNLQERLNELGYKVTIDGVYGSKTVSAIKKYQKKKGLPVTGEVDYKTWETIINETHYMPYAF